MNKPKTNADKYLKDGITFEDVWKELKEYFDGWQELDKNGIKATLGIFFMEKLKPTLTEDEKVILGKLPEKYMYIGRRDGTPSIELYIKSNDDFKHCWCFYNDLFQFIQPRRRI